MRRVEIFGRVVELQGSPYTFLVFRREFGGDLGAHIVEAYGKTPAEVEDFLRIAWAMAKTRDDGVSCYEEWLKEFPIGSFTLAKGSPVAVICSAVDAELFREIPPRKARERIAGLVGRLAQRIGAQGPWIQPR